MAPAGVGQGALPPSQEISKWLLTAVCVARSFEPERQKRLGHFLVGDMGAPGWEKGALAPNPLLEFKPCADFSGVPRIFGLEEHT